MSIKQIYLIGRNPRTTREEFLSNWRSHAKLAGSFPSLLSKFDGVTQCTVVASGPRGNEASRFDGANLLDMADLLGAVDLWSDPSQPTMSKDELRVFSGLIKENTLTTHESVLLDGPVTSAVLLQFVRRSSGTSPEDFITEWTGHFGGELLADEAVKGAVRRLVHDHVIFTPPAALEFDGVSELWFDDLDSAVALLQDDGYRQIADRNRSWSTPDEYLVLCEVGRPWRRYPVPE